MICAIDPGSSESAFIEWDGKQIHQKGIVPNHALLCRLRDPLYTGVEVAIERIRSYGQTVGDEVFETCIWCGRFMEACEFRSVSVLMVPRMEVKMHLCHSSRAKDGNISQALVDRFAWGEKNKGKGTAKKPGFFFGFKDDIWQAFALAVTVFDGRAQTEGKQAVA